MRSSAVAVAITSNGRCRSVGRRIRRIRWLLEGPLHRRAHRDIQVDTLRRDWLGEPLGVERRKLGTLIEACGRGIGNSLERRIILTQHDPILFWFWERGLPGYISLLFLLSW